MATKTTPHFRRTKKTGEWVVCAPADLLVEGATLDVQKRNGGWSTVTIERVGRPFTAGGETLAYGYIAPRRRRWSYSGGSYGGSRRPTCTCGEEEMIRRLPGGGHVCDECGSQF